MGLFTPNVAKLSSKGDAAKLVTLLGYQKDRKIAEQAGEALIKIGRPSLEHLAAALKGTDKVICAGAVIVLQRMDGLGEMDAAALTGVLKDEALDPLCRIPVAESLAKRADASAIMYLIDFLRDGKLDHLREQQADMAAHVMERSEVDPAYAQQLSALADRAALVIRMKEIKHELVKHEVVAALVRIGEPAIGPLTKASQYSHSDMRTGAQAALELMGTAAH